MLRKTKMVSVRFDPRDWERFKRLVDNGRGPPVIYGVYCISDLITYALQELYLKKFPTELEKESAPTVKPPPRKQLVPLKVIPARQMKPRKTRRRGVIS